MDTPKKKTVEEVFKEYRQAKEQLKKSEEE